MSLKNLIKRKTTWLLTIVAIGTLLVSSGCRQETITQNPPNPHIITVGTLSIMDALPLYVAEQEGYFKEQGLPVKIHTFHSTINEAQALTAGDLDIVLNDMVVASLAHKEGTPMKVIAMSLGATPKEGRYALVGAPGKGITSITQLKGKRIGISTNTMLEYMADSYLAHSHMTPSEVSYVKIPGVSDRMTALLEGKTIEAAVLPDPQVQIALKQGATLLADDTTSLTNLTQSALLGKDVWLQQHPEDVTKFLMAYNKAIRAINEHPDKYRPLLIKIAHLPESMGASYPMPTFTPYALPTQEEVAHIENWMVSKKLLLKPYTYDELVYKTPSSSK